jgi:hypothetical protein
VIQATILRVGCRLLDAPRGVAEGLFAARDRLAYPGGYALVFVCRAPTGAGHIKKIPSFHLGASLLCPLKAVVREFAKLLSTLRH